MYHQKSFMGTLYIGITLSVLPSLHISCKHNAFLMEEPLLMKLYTLEDVHKGSRTGRKNINVDNYLCETWVSLSDLTHSLSCFCLYYK